MTTGIYARISTVGKGQDVENQVAQIKAWAAQEGHEIVEVYTDQVSGSGKVRRPAFERMLEDAAAGKFKMLLFWSLDRLSRQGVLETLRILEKLDHAGVCWRSHTEAYLDSCGVFRDAVLAILAAIAKQERIRISERVKAGLDVARAQGRRGGRPPVEPDQEMLARVRELRQQGYSFNQIEAQTGCPRSSAHRLLAGQV